MNKACQLALAAFLPLAACASAPIAVAAQTGVPTGEFDAVELIGGGHVVIRHGSTHRVTVLRGDLQTSSITLGSDRGDERSLEIRACRRSCRNYDLRVEIVTPDVEALAITGGGTIDLEGAFPAQRSVALAVTGGGDLDARMLSAAEVAAAVHGGGVIRTHPRSALAASVSGGGAILYSGDPEVTSSVQGGGAVSRGDPR